MKKRKAYCVYYIDESEGVIVVFAHNRNEAKTIGFKKGPWMGDDYVYMRARRVPKLDKYVEIDTANFWYTCCRLNENWMYRIESCVSNL